MTQQNVTIAITSILLTAALLAGAFMYFETPGTELDQTARTQTSTATNGRIIIADSLEDLREEKKALIREHKKKGETPNRLIYAGSPYLLQHAFNPVDWHPWGEQAFEKARRENKPIFLSVGYSTCYWCHVMERKVFSDSSIARQMNEQFVSIKVDREQQPDVDRIYMTALQMMTQSGGWPMSMFLTPELKPFFGATYIPPNEEARNNQGFQAVLNRVDQVWNQERQQVIAQANKLTQALKDNMAAAGEPTSVGAAVLEQAAARFESQYDPEHGGFGQAPKFPRPAVPQFLLRYYEQTGHQQALDMTLHTLREMARGGTYDHVGEGFHRYSTDARWRVPHFEKMLYDQALLTQTYLQAYDITGENYFADVAENVLQFVDREMLRSEGGFYSALNAESPPDSSHLEEPVEGAYYVWTAEEIEKLLEPKTAEIFNYVYGVKDEGNALKDPHNVFVGKNILYRAHSAAEAADTFDASAEAVEEILAGAERRLLKARRQRIKPSLDDKIVLAWNGMMISAYARAYDVLGDEHYRDVAVRSAEFLLNHLYNPGSQRLQRVYRNGETMQEAALEDYAYLAGALLDIYEATSNERWLEQATRLTDRQIELFYDKENGGFYDATGEDETLLVRSKEFYGGARPAGNAAAVVTLARLHELTGEERYEELADETLRYFGQRLQQRPSAAPQMLKAFSQMIAK